MREKVVALFVLVAACKSGSPSPLETGLDLSIPPQDFSAPVCGSPYLAISGQVYDWLTGQPETNSVRVAAYDPLALLADPYIAPLAETVTAAAGAYSLGCLVAPAIGQLVVTVTGGTQTLVTTAVGTSAATTGKSVDLWALERSVVVDWEAVSGYSYAANGGVLVEFCDNSSTNVSIANCIPVSGVQVQPTPKLLYLGPARDAASATVTSTTSLGAIVFSPPAGPVDFGGGQDGGLATGNCAMPCSWQPSMLGFSPPPGMIYFAIEASHG